MPKSPNLIILDLPLRRKIGLETWTAQSAVQVSNFLCSGYNLCIPMEGAAGSMQSMEDVWTETSLRIRNFIRGRVEDDPTADDLLQEVFVRVHQNMARLQDTQRLESWIYQIVRHLIIDHYRSRRDHLAISDVLPDPSAFMVEPDSTEELTGSMRQMVEALPEPYREALLLTEFEGLSQQELADRQGISLSGAKSRVQRARQKIKDNLLSCCHFEFDRYGRVIDYWESCCCCAQTDEPQ
jgi:RNA polymerase sigma-70 factor, ECF subfamily